jgi:DNA-binding MarR family transcriptional regulator
MTSREDLLRLERSFYRILKALDQEWSKNTADFKVSKTQYFVLEILINRGEQTVTGLAEFMMLTSGAITGIADKLIEAGYDSRTRNETDRRIVHLQITEQGREFLEKLREQRSKAVQSLFAPLSDEKTKMLIEIHEQLLEHTEKNI